jgi:hypothetical protein
VGIERVGWGGWVGMGRRGGEEEGVGWGAGHFVKNVEESKLQTHNMIIYFVENTRAPIWLK